jgi:UDP-glucuronate decarboxylase
MNLGNPGEVTIVELAERITGAVGSASQVVNAPLPADDPVRRCPDIGLAQRTLGWQPKVPLEVGLQRTIEYFREIA